MIQGSFGIKIVDTTVGKTRRQHPVLVYMPRMKVVPYVSVWLGEAPGANTCQQYCKVLQRFCNYLARETYPHAEQGAQLLFDNREWASQFETDPEKLLKAIDDPAAKNSIRQLSQLLQFWRYADTSTLTDWKTYRLTTRNNSRKPDGTRVASPSNLTVDKEARVVVVFLDWVKSDMLVNTPWDGKRKTIKSSDKIERDDGLRGIVGSWEKEVPDANTSVFFSDDTEDNEPLPVSALAKDSQDDTYNYLYDDEVGQLLESFADKVSHASP